ncbi:MAG: hydroxyisourate hydrolase [Burkholderiales bacterium]|nr:hydroxyisourate hydrolase [Burkholderiales bacterium]
MQAVSIHIVDIANGRVAAGMTVEIWRIEGDAASHVVTGTVGANGVVDGIAERESLFEVGGYELRLHVADYYRKLGTELPEPAFIELALFRFALADLSQHYHLPVKLTAWGLSCFRGGA